MRSFERLHGNDFGGRDIEIGNLDAAAFVGVKRFDAVEFRDGPAQNVPDRHFLLGGGGNFGRFFAVFHAIFKLSNECAMRGVRDGRTLGIRSFSSPTVDRLP